MKICPLKSFLYSYTNCRNKTRLIGASNYEYVFNQFKLARSKQRNRQGRSLILG